eukprot:3094353-Amphidinium_carterae.2
MADLLQWTPTQTGWRQGDQHFSWDGADYKVKWDSTPLWQPLQLYKEVAATRPEFEGLDSGLYTQALRQLKLDGQSRKDTVNIALNAALGGVWDGARANAVFDVRDLRVGCGEAVEDLEHIVHHCPAWVAERREVALPAHAQEAPLVSSCMQGIVIHEPALTLVKVPLPGLKQSVYRAEFFKSATVRALEKCKPKRLISDCKGVVSCLHALRACRRHPKTRHKDLESRALAAFPAGVHIVWMKNSSVGQRCGRRACVLICKGTVWPMWRPTRVPVNTCPLNLPESGSSGLRVRPEQWPRVRLSAPEPEPEK